MRVKRHEDSQRSDRLAITQPVRPLHPPPQLFIRKSINRSG